MMLTKIIPPLTAFFIFISALPTLAGARVDIGRGSYIDLGFRLHTMFILDDSSSDYDNWQVRQARLRMKGVLNKYMTAFIQTEAAEENMIILDAIAGLTLHPLFNFYAGKNMAPASRQNLTSSHAMLAMERPAISHKTITWGARAVPIYDPSGYINPGLNDSIDNRDTGITAHGYNQIFSGMHFKYYLGFYEGIQMPKTEEGSGENKKRYTGRVQINLFDPEDQYYNLSNYLGRKKTIALGLSYDRQNSVASTSSWKNYRFRTVDIFTEMPIGPGSLSFEYAYQELRLGGSEDFGHWENGSGYATGKEASGTGYYVQTGYFVKNFQPWLLYENWESDAGNTGSFYSIRGGISIFIMDHNAKVKFGVEYFSPEAKGEDSVFAAMTGFYAQY